MSDKGSDVKYMFATTLQLKWEWCMAHMAHAATRASYGLNGGSRSSANEEMSDLIQKVTRTIYQVRTVEKTGDLFKALCNAKSRCIRETFELQFCTIFKPD